MNGCVSVRVRCVQRRVQRVGTGSARRSREHAEASAPLHYEREVPRRVCEYNGCASGEGWASVRRRGLTISMCWSCGVNLRMYDLTNPAWLSNHSTLNESDTPDVAIVNRTESHQRGNQFPKTNLQKLRAVGS